MEPTLSLVLFFLGAFGLAYLAGHSVITMPFRELIGGPIEKPRMFLGFFVALIECPACFGTWIGGTAGALMPGLFLQSTWWAGLLLGACATAAVNLMLGKACGLMPEGPDPMKEEFMRLVQSQIMRANEPLDWRFPPPAIDPLNEQPSEDTLTADDVAAMDRLPRPRGGQHVIARVANEGLNDSALQMTDDKAGV